MPLTDAVDGAGIPPYVAPPQFGTHRQRLFGRQLIVLLQQAEQEGLHAAVEPLVAPLLVAGLEVWGGVG
jgi:hypothetical protein